MRAGRLRHTVIVQRDANHGAADALGGEQSPDWQQVGPVRFANVMPLSGKERFEADQVKADISHRVEMRYDPAIETKPVYRLLHRNRVLQIEAVVNVGERNRELHVFCQEADV